jgi:hypothetical protein
LGWEKLEGGIEQWVWVEFEGWLGVGFGMGLRMRKGVVLGERIEREFWAQMEHPKEGVG